MQAMCNTEISCGPTTFSHEERWMLSLRRCTLRGITFP
jgi:hypothetical protein